MARRAGRPLGSHATGARIELLERLPVLAFALRLAVGAGADQEPRHRMELPDGRPPAVRSRARLAGEGAVVLRVIVLVVSQEFAYDVDLPADGLLYPGEGP